MVVMNLPTVHNFVMIYPPKGKSYISMESTNPKLARRAYNALSEQNFPVGLVRRQFTSGKELNSFRVRHANKETANAI